MTITLKMLYVAGYQQFNEQKNVNKIHHFDQLICPDKISIHQIFSRSTFINHSFDRINLNDKPKHTKMIKSKITSLVFAVGMCISTVANAQTWNTGSQVMTFTDASRGNRQIETQIFYPADVDGINVPLGSPIDKKFPVIVFGHDEEVDYTNYFSIWNKFTRYGFIVAFPTTEAGPNPNVEDFAKDLAFVATQFNLMRFTPGSFYFQRHNSKSCIMGHGVGGGAATIAMQYGNATTLVTLAATETTPSAISAATLVTKPSVVISGDEDCTAPAATNQSLMFNNIDSDCKTFVNMYDATHCHFAMNAPTCSEIMCNGSPNSFVHTVTLSSYLLVSFLRYYLKSNAPALARFEWKLQNKLDSWSYIMVCNVNPLARVGDDEEDMTTEESEMNFNLYPNPVKKGNALNMHMDSEISTVAAVYVSNMMGQVVYKNEVEVEEMESDLSIPIEHLRSGYYMVSVISEGGRISRPLVIQ